MTHQHTPLPSLDYLHELFQPHFMRGELTWKKAQGGKKSGAPAGSSAGSAGYVKIQIDGRTYLAHRLLYAMYHKSDPGAMEVDHKDRDRADNRIENLRLATHAQNAQNSRGHRKGLKGAYRNTSPTSKDSRPWVSTIQTNGVKTFLGAFATEVEAHEAYVAASVEYHGQFGRVH